MAESKPLARCAKVPIILDLLGHGTVTLTTVTLLAPHLTPANHLEVLEQARHQTKRQVEGIVARLRPLPDVPAIAFTEAACAAGGCRDHPSPSSAGPDDRAGEPVLPVLERTTGRRSRLCLNRRRPSQCRNGQPASPRLRRSATRSLLQLTVSRETLAIVNVLHRIACLTSQTAAHENHPASSACFLACVVPWSTGVPPQRALRFRRRWHHKRTKTSDQRAATR